MSGSDESSGDDASLEVSLGHIKISKITILKILGEFDDLTVASFLGNFLGILAIVIVAYGLFLAFVPWEFIGGPYCSAALNEYCPGERRKGGSSRPSSYASTGPSCLVFGLSID